MRSDFSLNTAVRYHSSYTGVLSFLGYVEDICLVALSDLLQTFNPNPLSLPLIYAIYPALTL